MLGELTNIHNKVRTTVKDLSVLSVFTGMINIYQCDYISIRLIVVSRRKVAWVVGELYVMVLGCVS